MDKKLKLLYIRDFLYRKTDDDHSVSVEEIIAYLAKQGISAERKSIYNDFEKLRLYGDDIISDRGRYSIGKRSFELHELKLLVDAVQSSQFITEKKTLELIKKLEGLASEHNASAMHREIVVRDRVKTMNESAYYAADSVFDAINEDKKISFQYWQYNLDKSICLRKNGALYKISPFALIWDNEKYYLYGYDGEKRIFKHFRVDKMQRITVLPEVREGKSEFSLKKLGAHRKITFGMFDGPEENVRLKCTEDMLDPIIDRFGTDLKIAPGDGFFTCTPCVAVSPVFFGWVCSFGGKIEILEPRSVREQMKEHTKRIAKAYDY